MRLTVLTGVLFLDIDVSSVLSITSLDMSNIVSSKVIVSYSIIIIRKFIYRNNLSVCQACCYHQSIYQTEAYIGIAARIDQ